MSGDQSLWRTIPCFVRVGMLGKTHGTQGELRIRLDQGREEDITNSGFLFVNISGSKVPYRIASFRQTKDLLISFDDVSDVRSAGLLAGCELYLPSDEVSQLELPETGPDLAYGYLTGYRVQTAEIEIGVIVEVREFPQQEMAVIEREGREILIPLHEDLIIGQDDYLGVVMMQLPEGLLDL